jgi:hypothetical protein
MLVAAGKSAKHFLLQNTSGNTHVQKPQNGRKTATSSTGRDRAQKSEPPAERRALHGRLALEIGQDLAKKAVGGT